MNIEQTIIEQAIAKRDSNKNVNRYELSNVSVDNMDLEIFSLKGLSNGKNGVNHFIAYQGYTLCKARTESVSNVTQLMARDNSVIHSTTCVVEGNGTYYPSLSLETTKSVILSSLVTRCEDALLTAHDKVMASVPLSKREEEERAMSQIKSVTTAINSYFISESDIQGLADFTTASVDMPTDIIARLRALQEYASASAIELVNV